MLPYIPYMDPMGYILLVGAFKHFLFSIIYGIIIPTDFHIFQRGWNHQLVYVYGQNLKVHMAFFILAYTHSSSYSGDLAEVWWYHLDLGWPRIQDSLPMSFRIRESVSVSVIIENLHFCTVSSISQFVSPKFPHFQ